MTCARFRLRQIVPGVPLLLFLVSPSAAQNRDASSPGRAEMQAPSEPITIASGTLLKADLSERVNWKRVSRNATIEARLALPVYSGELVGLPAGTPLRLTVESAEKAADKTGLWTKLGRAIVRAFNPLERGHAPQYVVRLHAAELALPDGTAIPIQASVLRTGSSVIVEPEAGRKSRMASGFPPKQGMVAGKRKPRPTLLLDMEAPIDVPVSAGLAQSPSEQRAARTDGARHARALLLNELSASRAHEGDVFHARLVEPVRVGEHLFVAGSLLDGRVVRNRSPRMLSRAGFLQLRMERVKSPEGETATIAGTLDHAEADAQTRFVIDEEGLLRGIKPGLTNAVVDLGLAFAVGKTTDDISEAPIRAIGAGMGDAAVANAARYVGLGASIAFLVTRHGRDVYLPKYGEIEVDFGR